MIILFFELLDGFSYNLQLEASSGIVKLFLYFPVDPECLLGSFGPRCLLCTLLKVQRGQEEVELLDLGPSRIQYIRPYQQIRLSESIKGLILPRSVRI